MRPGLVQEAVAVKITYNPGSGAVTFVPLRGPVAFEPYFDARTHVNLATSGAVQETVMESATPDILIGFAMPHLTLLDDLGTWALFMAWALTGGGFQLYPCSTLTDVYNCVLGQSQFAPKWKSPYRYGTSMVIRILSDGSAPATPEIVLRRFYGVTP